jgi:drug/metabolite transporter (DMT)-like permease
MIACGSAVVPIVVATVVGTPPSALQGAGIACALAGVLAITWTPSDTEAHVPLSRRALLLTVAASLSSGISFSVLLLSVKGGDGQTALGVASLARLTAAGIALATMALLTRPGKRPRPPLLPALGAGAADGLGVLLMLVAATLGNTAVTAVIVSLYAVVTVLLAQTVLHERIASRQALGVLAAAIGVILLSAGG